MALGRGSWPCLRRMTAGRPVQTLGRADVDPTRAVVYFTNRIARSCSKHCANLNRNARPARKNACHPRRCHFVLLFGLGETRYPFRIAATRSFRSRAPARYAADGPGERDVEEVQPTIVLVINCCAYFMRACPKGTSCARGDRPESGVFSSTRSRGSPAYPEPLRNPVRSGEAARTIEEPRSAGSTPGARRADAHRFQGPTPASKAPYC
jgi:hypothetical protein